jgi:hypothetical protein
VPYFRVRATNGRAEIVIEESFADEAELRAVLPQRGWTTILSVEPIAAPTTAGAPDAIPPPPIRADQLREDGEWVYLPQELAEQHPLHGIGGWTGLLLALMVLGTVLALVPMFQLGSYLSDGGGLVVAIFLAVLAVQIVNVVAIVLLVNRSPAFPPTFVALTVIGLVLTVVLFALGDVGIGNIVGMITQILWLCYVLMSKRVNVTFRRRVEREDEWLKQGLAAAESPATAATR